MRCGAVELVDGEVRAVGCLEYEVGGGLAFKSDGDHVQVGRDKIRTFEDKLDGNDDELRQATDNT